MSECDQNLEVMDLYAAGFEVLDDLDQEHLARCPTCRIQMQRSRQLRSRLADFVAAYDELPDPAYARRRRAVLRDTVRFRLRQRFPAVSWRWAAVAASLIGAFLLGRLLTPSVPPETGLRQQLIASITAESAREEVVNYLGRTQFFLLTLLEEDRQQCASGDEAKRGIARRLLYQKKLLEPQLADERYRDIRNLLDELEVLLLDVADGEGCFKTEESDLWKGILSSRPTLVKLDLLQVKGRI